MGASINDKWFGDPANDGPQIVLNAWIRSATAASNRCFIIKQKATNQFLVQNEQGQTGVVTLVNKNALNDLERGEAFLIGVHPDRGNLVVRKLLQNRLVTFGTGKVKHNWKDWDADNHVRIFPTQDLPQQPNNSNVGGGNNNTGPDHDNNFNGLGSSVPRVPQPFPGNNRAAQAFSVSGLNTVGVINNSSAFSSTNVTLDSEVHLQHVSVLTTSPITINDLGTSQLFRYELGNATWAWEDVNEPSAEPALDEMFVAIWPRYASESDTVQVNTIFGTQTYQPVSFHDIYRSLNTLQRSRALPVTVSKFTNATQGTTGIDSMNFNMLATLDGDSTVYSSQRIIVPILPTDPGEAVLFGYSEGVSSANMSMGVKNSGVEVTVLNLTDAVANNESFTIKHDSRILFLDDDNIDNHRNHPNWRNMTTSITTVSWFLFTSEDSHGGTHLPQFDGMLDIEVTISDLVTAGNIVHNTNNGIASRSYYLKMHTDTTEFAHGFNTAIYRIDFNDVD